MSRSIPVVINADDFGYSRTVNSAISEALKLRRISSSTIIANGPAVLDALSIAQCHPEASFGIHLNLTEFSPLTPPENWRRFNLVDAAGRFNGGIRHLYPSLHLMRLVAREYDAQIQYLISRGLSPSHLDSHHHVHTIAWLLPVLVWLQRRYRLPFIRNTMNVYPQNHKLLFRLQLAKSLWRGTCSNMFGFQMPQIFADLDQFLLNPNRSVFRMARCIELMCHPGQRGYEKQTRELLSRAFPSLTTPFVLVPFQKACTGRSSSWI